MAEKGSNRKKTLVVAVKKSSSLTDLKDHLAENEEDEDLEIIPNVLEPLSSTEEEAEAEEEEEEELDGEEGEDEDPIE